MLDHTDLSPLNHPNMKKLFIFIIYFFKHTHIYRVVGECQTGALSLGTRVNIKHPLKKVQIRMKKVSHTIFEALSTFKCFLFKIFEYVFILKTV